MQPGTADSQNPARHNGLEMAEYGSFSATGSGNGRHGQRKSEVFDQQTLADAQLLFKLVDTDSDGRLDANELNNHLSDMGVPSHDIDGLFYNLDANGDGQVLSHTRNRDLTLELPALVLKSRNFTSGTLKPNHRCWS